MYSPEAKKRLQEALVAQGQPHRIHRTLKTRPSKRVSITTPPVSEVKKAGKEKMKKAQNAISVQNVFFCFVCLFFETCFRFGSFEERPRG